MIYLQRLGADGNWHNVEVRFVTQRLDVPVRLDVRQGRARTSSVPGSPATRQRRRRVGAGDDPGVAGHVARRRSRPPHRGRGVDKPDSRGGAIAAPAPVACPAMDFELTDEQRLIRETARAFTDNEIVERARENDRNEHFDLELVAQDRRPGLPRRDRPARVRRRRTRLPDLRADRRGDRPRRLGDADRGLGPDLAGVLGDPALGHRGAEAAATCPSCARASGSAASG